MINLQTLINTKAAIRSLDLIIQELLANPLSNEKELERVLRQRRSLILQCDDLLLCLKHESYINYR